MRDITFALLAYLLRSLSDIGSVVDVAVDFVPVAAIGELNFDDFDFTKLFVLFEFRTVHIFADVVPPAIVLSLEIVLTAFGLRPDASAHAFRITFVFFSSDFSFSMRVLLKDRLPRLILLFIEVVAFDEVVDDSDEDVCELLNNVVRVGGVHDVSFNSKLMDALPFSRSSAAAVAAAVVGLFRSVRRVRRPLFELIGLFETSEVVVVLVLSVLVAIAAVVVWVQCSSLAPLRGVII